jgi:hypothetical protein
MKTNTPTNLNLHAETRDLLALFNGDRWITDLVMQSLWFALDKEKGELNTVAASDLDYGSRQTINFPEGWLAPGEEIMALAPVIGILLRVELLKREGNKFVCPLYRTYALVAA